MVFFLYHLNRGRANAKHLLQAGNNGRERRPHRIDRPGDGCDSRATGIVAGRLAKEGDIVMRRSLTIVSALMLLAAPAFAEDASNLNPGVSVPELLETAPVHWVSIGQIAASLEGEPAMAVGFDVDDTVLFSSPCFYYGKTKYSPTSEDYLKMDEFWTDIHSNNCDQYSMPKEVGRKLIELHTQRGDEIFFITGRTRGSGGETLTGAIKAAFGIEKMNDVVFTASSENKVEFLKDHKLKIYYGDADSDMKAAIAAGIRPIRVMRAQNSTYKPDPKNGSLGEEVIVNSTN